MGVEDLKTIEMGEISIPDLEEFLNQNQDVAKRLVEWVERRAQAGIKPKKEETRYKPT